MLKRGISATLREWLLAAEYLLNEGESRVILCERGVRNFDDHARYHNQTFLCADRHANIVILLQDNLFILYFCVEVRKCLQGADYCFDKERAETKTDAMLLLKRFFAAVSDVDNSLHIDLIKGR